MSVSIFHSVQLLEDLASLNDHNAFWLAIGRTCCSSPIDGNQVKVRTLQLKKNISYFWLPCKAFQVFCSACFHLVACWPVSRYTSKMRSYRFNWNTNSLRAKFIMKSLAHQLHPQIAIDFPFQPSLVANGIWQLHRHHLNDGMDL